MSAKKILYVEDEAAMATIVSDALQRRGFEVAVEHRGDLALARFRQFAPHVCVLDVMLPGKDGFSLAADIRSLDAGVPIIFLTAKSAVADVVNGFQQGGNDYIRKPFSIEELIVRIENLTKEKKAALLPAATADEVQLGQYMFQKTRQVLAHPTGQRKLSYRESELLKMLCNNKNSIVERRDILNQLWGSDSFFNSRTLDVYITKLRNYFKEDPSVEIITIKGIGYRFVQL